MPPHTIQVSSLGPPARRRAGRAAMAQMMKPATTAYTAAPRPNMSHHTPAMVLSLRALGVQHRRRMAATAGDDQHRRGDSRPRQPPLGGPSLAPVPERRPGRLAEAAGGPHHAVGATMASGSCGRRGGSRPEDRAGAPSSTSKVDWWQGHSN